jgi:hypothetical protein
MPSNPQNFWFMIRTQKVEILFYLLEMLALASHFLFSFVWNNDQSSSERLARKKIVAVTN